jgi:hypothetical protein
MHHLNVASLTVPMHHSSQQFDGQGPFLQKNDLSAKERFILMRIWPFGRLFMQSITLRPKKATDALKGQFYLSRGNATLRTNSLVNVAKHECVDGCDARMRGTC